MKKILSMLIVGLFTGLSFASASWVSDCEITQCTFSERVPSYNGDYDMQINGLQDFINLRFTYSPSNAVVQVSDGSVVCENGLCSSDDLYDFGDGEHLFLHSDGVNFGSCAYVSSENNCSLTWVADSPGNGGNEGGSIIGNTNAVSQGVINGVNSFTAGLGNIVPVLILLGLPIFIVVLFWRKVWSYLKHFFSPR